MAHASLWISDFDSFDFFFREAISQSIADRKNESFNANKLAVASDTTSKAGAAMAE
ncbi:hypothetical protein BN2476_300003 [Paraburkholderia piptadeniae]|uniref:Uncharacterized protein n=1 Tax=Paraburkholderia piptadeniae TaxID=1701573 RepID=A0A1N7S275_9BURK|nr:hypothetical protein BN2476_300003 [Paraburkholderia piptadeniae]